MRWFDRKIDQFIRRIRDNPAQTPITVGPPDDPTYHRYFVIRRNRWLNFYLHCFHHDDEEHLHDHRAANISILLQGGYFEERFIWRPVEGYPLPPTTRFQVQSRRILFRRPSTPHRVVLYRDSEGRPIPVWSLFIKFPDVRNWGFWLPGALWVPYTEYVADPDPNSSGYGRRKDAA